MDDPCREKDEQVEQGDGEENAEELPQNIGPVGEGMGEIDLGGILFPAVFSLMARYASFQISLLLFPVFSLAGFAIIFTIRRRIVS